VDSVARRGCSVDCGSDRAVCGILHSQAAGTCLLPVHGALPVLLPVRLGLRIPDTLLSVAMDIPALGMGPPRKVPRVPGRVPHPTRQVREGRNHEGTVRPNDPRPTRIKPENTETHLIIHETDKGRKTKTGRRTVVWRTARSIMCGGSVWPFHLP